MAQGQSNFRDENLNLDMNSSCRCHVFREFILTSLRLEDSQSIRDNPRSCMMAQGQSNFWDENLNLDMNSLCRCHVFRDFKMLLNDCRTVSP